MQLREQVRIISLPDELAEPVVAHALAGRGAWRGMSGSWALRSRPGVKQVDGQGNGWEIAVNITVSATRTGSVGMSVFAAALAFAGLESLSSYSIPRRGEGEPWAEG